VKRRKVFGIGFHKTGTSSLGVALNALGYRVCGALAVDDPDIATKAAGLAIATARDYDAAQDNPWPIVYRDLDAAFPGSRFVLTIRDTDVWITSMTRHFADVDTEMRKWIYGVGHPAGHEAAYKRRYERHNREVLAYFAKRPADLLVLDFAAGDGWEQLCGFLGHAVPADPFPHANPGAEASWLRRIVTSPTWIEPLE